MQNMRFIHFKGNEYIVLCYAKNSETDEDLVVYKRTADDKIWARPMSMFFDVVNVAGKEVPRFEPIVER